MPINSLQQLQLNKQHATKLYHQGKLKAAENILKKICKKGIEDAEAYYLLGSIYGDSKKFDKAITQFNKAKKLNPGVAVIHLNLGVAYSALNKLSEAHNAFMNAHRLEPKNYNAVLNVGLTLAEQNLYTDASTYLQKALEINPESTQALQTLGGILYKQKDYNQAIVYFDRLNKVDATNVISWGTLGSIYFLLSRANQAIECFIEVTKLDASNVEAHVNLGLTYKLIGERDKALQSYNLALSYDANNTVATIGIIELYERNGEYQDAYEPLLKLMAKGIHHADLASSYLNLCHRFDDCKKAVDYANKTLLNNDINELEMARLQFSLGRYFDKRNEYDLAFSHYKKANSLSTNNFSILECGNFFNSYIQQFNWQFFTKASRSGIRSGRPVFIVGMPRSGTTLIEQILASHPEVYGAGELTGIGSLANKFGEILQQQPMQYPAGLLDLNSNDLDKLAQHYLDLLSEMNTTAVKVVDKMPANFMHLGLINLLFPDAKVIHCTRDPLDTCLSIYFQAFSNAEPYANNLENIAYYFTQYKSFMKHIKSLTSLQVLDLSYEKMVEDQEAMTKKLIEFVGLDWDERCMSFDTNMRFVATPSYDQVRKKIYTKSVGRWRNYKKHLEKAIKILGHST
jgi:tetratricopeptide (TPR) repeat protein